MTKNLLPIFNVPAILRTPVITEVITEKAKLIKSIRYKWLAEIIIQLRKHTHSWSKFKEVYIHIL